MGVSCIVLPIVRIESEAVFVSSSPLREVRLGLTSVQFNPVNRKVTGAHIYEHFWDICTVGRPRICALFKCICTVEVTY